MERGTRAELLRPGASAWEPAGQTVRIFHVGPICVSNHQVVIAGGRDNGLGFAIIEGTHYAPPIAQSTEIWEHAGRTWRTAAGPLAEPRDDAKGVTLSDGRILVVGGWHEGNLLKSAELWAPRTESWSPTGALNMARSSFALTALPNGRAAVSGGLGEGPFQATEAVEIWDPERGTWSPGTPLAQGRWEPHALPRMLLQRRPGSCGGPACDEHAAYYVACPTPTNRRISIFCISTNMSSSPPMATRVIPELVMPS